MLRFESNFTATVADATNVVRLLFYQWYPDDASDPPTPGTILENITYGWASVHRLDAKVRRKFKILYDRAIVLSTSNACAQISANIDCSTLRKVEYTAGATSGKNLLYYLVVSDSVAVSHPSYTFSTGLYFQDA